MFRRWKWDWRGGDWLAVAGERGEGESLRLSNPTSTYETFSYFPPVQDILQNIHPSGVNWSKLEVNRKQGCHVGTFLSFITQPKLNVIIQEVRTP